MEENTLTTPMTEGDGDGKHQKFLDTSEDMVKKAIQAVEKIGKCSNRKQFAYSDEEVEKMFGAIQEALDDTRELFKEKKTFSW